MCRSLVVHRRRSGRARHVAVTAIVAAADRGPSSAGTAAWLGPSMEPAVELPDEFLSIETVSGIIAPEGVDLAIALGPDRGGLAELVRRAKRSGADPRIGAGLGHAIADAIRRHVAIPDARRALVVVPVPGAAARSFSRGHDHARGLARHVARRLGSPMKPRLLAHRGGRRQAGRSRRNRVRSASLTIRRGRGRLRNGRTVVLIDDIRTTGATLAASAGLLREAGAERVIAATVTARSRNAPSFTK